MPIKFRFRGGLVFFGRGDGSPIFFIMGAVTSDNPQKPTRTCTTKSSFGAFLAEVPLEFA